MPDHALDHVGGIGVARRIDWQRLKVRLIHSRLVRDLHAWAGQLVERETRALCAHAHRVALRFVGVIPLVPGGELEIDLRLAADLAFCFLGELVALARGCDQIFVGFTRLPLGYNRRQPDAIRRREKMTIDERIERLEHSVAGHIEQAKKDCAENRQLWREMRDEAAAIWKATDRRWADGTDTGALPS